LLETSEIERIEAREGGTKQEVQHCQGEKNHEQQGCGVRRGIPPNCIASLLPIRLSLSFFIVVFLFFILFFSFF
jgi:hypothetical protein